MGGLATKEAIEGSGNSRTLNISRKLTPQEYAKHMSGTVLDGSLSAIPWEVYYNTVSMYEKIYANFNFITEIPRELSTHVPHLRHLVLGHNQLQSLPDTFHLFLHLRVLDLSYNCFQSFPEVVVELPKLMTLDMSHNKLTEVPSSFCKLKKLKRLNVSHNKLRALPNALIQCHELVVIVTHGNDMIHPPQSVCDSGSQATLNYLQERHTPVPVKAVPEVIFVRVRGQQVLASVNNPESASVEYRQAQGTARSNRRKCPLMPPVDATVCSPDQLKDSLLGLVYGAAVADAIALNTEQLTKDECEFFYDSSGLSLEDRVVDELRSHFPPCDWSSNADVMLLTLESLMRWGGVVDELEFASQLRQWLIHGFADIDSYPGKPLSPLLDQVIRTEGFATNPHAVADYLYKSLRLELKKGLRTVNLSDNSCLPAALVLGIPFFYKEEEVIMNSDRICRATHANSTARAACMFTALLIASILQGKLQQKNSREGMWKKLKEKSANSIADEKEQLRFLSLLDGTSSDSLPKNDVMKTLIELRELILTGDICFKSSVQEVVMQGGDGVSACSCVIGGTLGAYLGYSQLPHDWLLQLPVANKAWLNGKVNLLLDLFGLP